MPAPTPTMLGTSSGSSFFDADPGLIDRTSRPTASACGAAAGRAGP